MSIWGPLEKRYTTTQPRKILALDGGGIRGLITLEILKVMEDQLKAKFTKEEFCLADYFDYIGGTSTGAIIAAGLSLGMTCNQLISFYNEEGEKMFAKRSLFNRWRAKYRTKPLTEMLKATFGNETNISLENGMFKCLLLVVTMNRTTDSPWPISNNPLAKYNDPSRSDCNLNIPLYQLVRASTAAPTYFKDEKIILDENNPKKQFVFVDGGVTPYNNPAFLMYRMATQPAYMLNWELSEDKLLVVSVGTGASPSSGIYKGKLDVAKRIPDNLMYAMQVDQDINCRTVGRCSYGAPIDRVLHDMIPIDSSGEMLKLSQRADRHFLYARYNADLSREGLDEIGLSNIKSKDVREMDSTKHMDKLQKVGEAASKQVSLDHFGSFV